MIEWGRVKGKGYTVGLGVDIVLAGVRCKVRFMPAVCLT